jgi:hypothetical protein
LWPPRPLAQPAPLASLLSRAEFNLTGPASPRVDGVFAEVHFPFWFAPSELAASLSSLCQVGPGCPFCLPPPPADRYHFLSSPPTTPHRPTSDLEMPGEVFTPCLDPPPLISLLNHSSSRPAINGIKAITPAVSPSPAPKYPSPATIKGRGARPGHHHTHLALNRLLSSP